MINEKAQLCIDNLYNSFSQSIITIVEAGSRLLDFLADTAHGYDILVVIDTKEHLSEIKKYINDNLESINEADVDFRLLLKSELKDKSIKLFDWQYYFINKLEPIYGKKVDFKSKLDTNKAGYIQLLINYIDNSITPYIEEYHNKLDYIYIKQLYHLFVAFYMLVNESYDEFRPDQIKMIKQAKDCKISFKVMKFQIAEILKPTLYKLLKEIVR